MIISVRFASASPDGFLTFIVYSPTSSSTTFLMVRLADCSSDVLATLGDFLTTLPDVYHSDSGFGVPESFILNVTSSFSLTL